VKNTLAYNASMLITIVKVLKKVPREIMEKDVLE
jgi:hypothetical protein